MVTIALKRSKQHRCAACGSLFSYLVEAQGTAHRDGSREDARMNAVRWIMRRPTAYPCPACGVVQPDQVGQRRELAHALLLVAAFGAAVTLPAGLEWVSVPAHLILPGMAGVAALFILAHAAAAWYSPNRFPRQNLARAAEAGAAGDLVLDAPGPEGGLGARRRLMSPWFCWLGFAALALSLPMIAGAEIVRAFAGWPVNADCRPNAAGPGDEVRVYFPAEGHSLDGRWQGLVAVAVLNAKELDIETALPATTRTEAIGQWVEDKPKSFRPWAKVKIPDAERLAGKVLRLYLRAQITYPVREGNGFVTRCEVLDHVTELRMAPPRAGAVYTLLEVAGASAGAGLSFVGAVLLIVAAARLKRAGYAAVLL